MCDCMYVSSFFYGCDGGGACCSLGLASLYGFRLNVAYVVCICVYCMYVMCVLYVCKASPCFPGVPCVGWASVTHLMCAFNVHIECTPAPFGIPSGVRFFFFFFPPFSFSPSLLLFSFYFCVVGRIPAVVLLCPLAG